MATVTFPPALGGDGTTVTDDANPSTGLANGGHRVRFVPALNQTVAVISGAVSQATALVADAAAEADDSAASAAASAASAASSLTAPGTSATSTSSITIGSGSRALTLAQTGKSFVVGQFVTIADATSPSTRWMLAAITAFTSGTGAMTVTTTSTRGTGASSNWVVTAAAPVQHLANLPVPTTVATNSQTAVAGGYYVMTHTAGVTTLTLPSSPAAGDVVRFDNATGRVDMIVARNGQNIMGLAEDMNPFDLPGAWSFVFVDASLGWRFAP